MSFAFEHPERFWCISLILRRRWEEGRGGGGGGGGGKGMLSNSQQILGSQKEK